MGLNTLPLGRVRGQGHRGVIPLIAQLDTSSHNIIHDSVRLPTTQLADGAAVSMREDLGHSVLGGMLLR